MKIIIQNYSFWCWHGWSRVRVMVFNATFNNISAISWQSVLLVEKTGVPWENHWPVANDWQKLYHIMLYRELTTSVVIGTDCIGSCQFNYHMITATMVPYGWSILI